MEPSARRLPVPAALYAQYGIPHYCRIELEPPKVTMYERGHGDAYRVGPPGDRLIVDEPFEVDLAISEVLPRCA